MSVSWTELLGSVPSQASPNCSSSGRAPPGEWPHCAFVCMRQKSGRLLWLLSSSPCPVDHQVWLELLHRVSCLRFTPPRVCSPHSSSSSVSKSYILSCGSSYKQPFVELLTCRISADAWVWHRRPFVMWALLTSSAFLSLLLTSPHS